MIILGLAKGTHFSLGRRSYWLFLRVSWQRYTLQNPNAVEYTDLTFRFATEKATHWLAFLWLPSSRMEQRPLNWILMRQHHQLLRRIPDHSDTFTVLGAAHQHRLTSVEEGRRKGDTEVDLLRRLDQWLGNDFFVNLYGSRFSLCQSEYA